MWPQGSQKCSKSLKQEEVGEKVLLQYLQPMYLVAFYNWIYRKLRLLGLQLTCLSWFCLDAKVAPDACFNQFGNCRKTLFSQRCSSRYVIKIQSTLSECLLTVRYCWFLVSMLCGSWLQRSILRDTFLHRGLGVSSHIQEVLLQSGKWRNMQWGNFEPWR